VRLGLAANAVSGSTLELTKPTLKRTKPDISDGAFASDTEMQAMTPTGDPPRRPSA